MSRTVEPAYSALSNDLGEPRFIAESTGDESVPYLERR